MSTNEAEKFQALLILPTASTPHQIHRRDKVRVANITNPLAHPLVP